MLTENQISSSFNLMITYFQFYKRSVAISKSGTYLFSLYIDRFFLPPIFVFYVFFIPSKDRGKFCPLSHEFIICSNTYHFTLQRKVLCIYKNIFFSTILNLRKNKLNWSTINITSRWLRITINAANSIDQIKLNKPLSEEQFCQLTLDTAADESPKSWWSLSATHKYI